jgi:hypothetical protein
MMETTQTQQQHAGAVQKMCVHTGILPHKEVAVSLAHSNGCCAGVAGAQQQW